MVTNPAKRRRRSARRWKREGRRVRIARPPQGMDFNDLLEARASLIHGGRAMSTSTPPLNPISRSADAIDGAEEMVDPLDGLGREDRRRSGCPLHARSAGALAVLKQDNRAAFEALRAQLKKVGCRVTALDEALAEESGEGDGRGPKQADILIDLRKRGRAVSRAPTGPAIADLDVSGHRETWPIRSKGFKRWLARRFYRRDRRRAKLRGAAIGSQRDRGQGAFRCAGAAGPCPRRRTRRPALSRPWR